MSANASKRDGVIPVIIVQSISAMLDVCEDALSQAGLVQGRDYTLNDAADSITANDIIPGERQLLIIGTIHGDKLSADQFVRDMKSKNPNLKAAFFSLYSIDGNIEPYDMIIPKRIVAPSALIKEIQEFLKG